MTRTMLKSKIHRATCTGGELHYEGSLSIGPEMMRAADILVGEQVHVVDVNNGNRFVTYAIEGVPGEMRLNGGAAHLGQKGDLLIVITYTSLPEAEARDYRATVVHVDSANRVLEPALSH
ncbi:MAG: aspartate 1-decarboxylase [Candidatus Dormibacteria bacterium]